MPVQEVELQLDGYDLFSNVNICKRGVLIYTKKELKASPSTAESFCDFDESCWCEIRLKEDDKLLIGCVYRSPNSDALNNSKIVSAFKRVFDRSNFTHILICGDFNIPEVNWVNETTPASQTHYASVFMECLRDCFLYQHVKEPTHVKSNQAANTLDLILTNEEGMIENLQYNAPIGKSDHLTLNFTFKCYSDTKVKKPRKYKLDKGNYDLLREKIAQYDWKNDMEKLSCQDSWDLFSDRMRAEMDVFADVSREGSIRELQEDIQRLEEWAKKWQLTFDIDKCKVMHIGLTLSGAVSHFDFFVPLIVKKSMSSEMSEIWHKGKFWDPDLESAFRF